MAAGATDSEPQQPAGNDVNAVVVDVVVHPSVGSTPKRQEPERREIAVVVRLGFREQVGGDLLHDKPVVGLILVERFDHPVPVGKRKRIGVVPVENSAHVVGITSDIQPVARPALAVVR